MAKGVEFIAWKTGVQGNKERNLVVSSCTEYLSSIRMNTNGLILFYAHVCANILYTHNFERGKSIGTRMAEFDQANCLIRDSSTTYIYPPSREKANESLKVRTMCYMATEQIDAPF